MMKNLLLAGALVLGGSAMAQNFNTSSQTPLHPNFQASDRVADTVWTYLNRGTQFFSYGAPDGGNAIGNGYVDLGGGPIQALDGVGMHYDAIGGASVTEVLVWFAEGFVVGSADNITARVQTVNADSTPNMNMGASTITTADADLAGGLTSMLLGSPANVAGVDFALTIEWPGADDTIGIVGSANGDGAGEERVLSYFSAAAAGTPTWAHTALYTNFDLDIMIFPVVDAPAGVEMFQNGLGIESVYPNPTNGIANVKYRLEETEEINIRVFNLLGEEVYTETGSKTAGEHIIQLDTESLNAGNYYFTIKTDRASLTSKFIVTK